LKISPTSLFGDGAISNSRMRTAILEQNQKQGIPSPRAEHKAKLMALGIVSGHRPNLLAEMRKHPGGSAQHQATFATLQTGRLAPNRYY
jgi:hypothetical protein